MKRLPLALSLLLTLSGLCQGQDRTMLNVSYDPTRQMYAAYNRLFAQYWLDQTGETLEVYQSHGGSGKQGRSVLDGLDADVVTLALAYDIDKIAQRSDLLPKTWQARLPFNSAPYTSTIVFLVRKGNPKQISDWRDLVKPGVAVVTPNPRTSGGARWNYLAGWGSILAEQLGVAALIQPEQQPGFAAADAEAQKFMTELFAEHVPILDTAARAATTSFAINGLGDVLLTWENEAMIVLKELGTVDFELVVPKVSILAEPTVAWLDKNIKKDGNQEVAEAYLKYLYEEPAQELIAKFHYRPRSKTAAARFPLPALHTFTIDETFGGWQVAQTRHFIDGGVFDQIMAGKK